MKHRLAAIGSIACCLLIFLPRDLLAAGSLWPQAGPYVNEIAHLLFLGAMIFFISRLPLSLLGLGVVGRMESRCLSGSVGGLVPDGPLAFG